MDVRKKKLQWNKKLTPTQLREENEKLRELVDTGVRCEICNTLKTKDKFYSNTDPMCKLEVGTVCRECARKIAFQSINGGVEYEPTKESVQLALKYLNKPFLNKLWDASVQEYENAANGSINKASVWGCYIKNIAMEQYYGLSYFDSDHFTIGEPTKNGGKSKRGTSVNKMLRDHEGQDTYDSFQKNKADVIRLLDYDPFEKELIADQPFLYAQLLALMDTNAESNEDMIRTSSAISIARGFLQASKLDDTLAKLMADAEHLEKNAATIKSIQESKQKVMTMITNLAAESCLSLKNSKHSVKGENTWTGKIKKIKDLNLRGAEVNGFDIATCRGMQQVREISDASIMKQLQLDESEWSDMVAEMRVTIQDLRSERDQYKEINRILLRENIDLKDYLEEIEAVPDKPYLQLKDIYSVFADQEDNIIDVEENEDNSLNLDLEEEGDADEQDTSSE